MQKNIANILAGGVSDDAIIAYKNHFMFGGLKAILYDCMAASSTYLRHIRRRQILS